MSSSKKSRLGLTAVAFASSAFLFIFLAFVTTSWLVTDGELANPKFERIGLWVVCFHDFDDIRHHHDTKFTGCWWVYEEEFYIIHEVLLPGFFIATQFFFSICFILTILAAFMLLTYMCTSKASDRFICLVSVLGGDMIIAAFCGSIAVILFGANGDRRYWMPNWEHNNMGWSYAIAVVGTVGLYIGGILFLIESRVNLIKHRRFRQDVLDYAMEERRMQHSTHSHV